MYEYHVLTILKSRRSVYKIKLLEKHNALGYKDRSSKLFHHKNKTFMLHTTSRIPQYKKRRGISRLVVIRNNIY